MGGSVIRLAPMLWHPYRLVLLALLLTTSGGAAEPLVSATTKPPKNSNHPMVMTPIVGVRLVDDELRQYLARCDRGRPLCDTGMACFGWTLLGFTIEADGRPRGFRSLASCPDAPLPSETWERLLEWRYNPKISGGKAVPQEAWLTLAYLLPEIRSVREPTEARFDRIRQDLRALSAKVDSLQSTTTAEIADLRAAMTPAGGAPARRGAAFFALVLSAAVLAMLTGHSELVEKLLTLLASLLMAIWLWSWMPVSELLVLLLATF